MVALLGKIRKQMNGAVLDTFRYYGAKYGMNYGVALHSLREMAREVGCDDDLAHFLYRQQVRELQIIALWIADAKGVTIEQFDHWAAGTDAKTRELMNDYYLKAALCEYAFWDYAYEGESKSYEYIKSLEKNPLDPSLCFIVDDGNISKYSYFQYEGEWLDTFLKHLK